MSAFDNGTCDDDAKQGKLHLVPLALSETLGEKIFLPTRPIFRLLYPQNLFCFISKHRISSRLLSKGKSQIYFFSILPPF